ncbi:MAG: phage/plasmid primase, P4 family [Bacteroidaceae bacterium]
MNIQSKLKQYLSDGLELPSGFGLDDANPKESKTWSLTASFLEQFSKGFIKGGLYDIMFFNGLKYEQVSTEQVKEVVREILLEKGTGGAYMLRVPARIASECVSMAISKNPFKAQRGLIAFANGILDLESMDDGRMGFRDVITPADQTRFYFKEKFDPNIKCPRFDAFLDRVLPRLEVRYALQEFVGAAFLNRNKYQIHKMCFMLGGGSNGKSVFMDAIEYVFGKDNCSNYSTDDLFIHEKKQNAIANINGKMLNICHDISNNNIFGGDFNKFVAGEPMIGRFMRHDQFTVTDIPLFMGGLNEMPATRDWSNGYLRRLLIIPFDVTISDKEADPQLLDKLKLEKMGILNWIIQGRMRFVKQGCKFTESEDTNRAKRMNIMNALSPIKFMYTNRFFPKKYGPWMDIKRISNTELYSSYKLYMKENNPRGGVFEARRFLELVSRVGEYEIYRQNTERGKIVYTLAPDYAYDVEYDMILDPNGKVLVDSGKIIQDEIYTKETEKEKKEIFTQEELEAMDDLPM